MITSLQQGAVTICFESFPRTVVRVTLIFSFGVMTVDQYDSHSFIDSMDIVPLRLGVIESNTYPDSSSFC